MSLDCQIYQDVLTSSSAAQTLFRFHCSLVAESSRLASRDGLILEKAHFKLAEQHTAVLVRSSIDDQLVLENVAGGFQGAEARGKLLFQTASVNGAIGYPAGTYQLILLVCYGSSQLPRQFFLGTPRLAPKKKH